MLPDGKCKKRKNEIKKEKLIALVLYNMSCCDYWAQETQSNDTIIEEKRRQ